jgi:D,D-heptose 1,7-bisphosphate phosphatase
MKKNAAVFLDRDGTINEEVGFLDSLEKLKIFPQAIEAIKRINESGMKAVIITNQSGVARGFFDEAFVMHVHKHIGKTLQDKGATIDGFYYCPHHPIEGHKPYLKSCTCRKPEVGLIIQAAKDFNIDLPRSYMIGDTAKDIEMASRIGAKGVLVKTGYGSNIDVSECHPAHVAEDVLDAVDWIMKDRKK